MLFQYCSNESEYALNNFDRGKICFSHVDQFNDTMEFDAKMSESLSLPNSEVSLIEEQIQLQKLRIRICCFSQSPCLDNMWGYYANKNRGFCLGYDRDELEKLLPQLVIKKVKYSDEPIIFKEGMTPEELVMSQILHKKKCWSEEKEIRASFFLNCDDIIKISLQFGESIFKEKYDYVFNDMAYIKYPALTLDTPIENRIPSVWYSPKNILVNLEPKILIIGKKCPKHTANILKNIAESKRIEIKNQGDIIE